MTMAIRLIQAAFSIMAGLLASATAAEAQTNGLLYDPEPPANSAYVRVIHVSREGAVEVLVDGKTRVRSLAAGDASEYLVLPAGKHTLELKSAGKPGSRVSTALEVDSGSAMTVAFPALRAEEKPLVYEDKANSNKLKAVLAVYHLHPSQGPLDVLSADGAIKVFGNLAPGGSSQLSVNPISIELIAAKAGDKAAKARARFAMEPGGTYSMLLLPGEGGKLKAQAVQNRVERYTGK